MAKEIKASDELGRKLGLEHGLKILDTVTIKDVVYKVGHILERPRAWTIRLDRKFEGSVYLDVDKDSEPVKRYWVLVVAGDGFEIPYFRANGLSLEEAEKVKKKLEGYSLRLNKPYRSVEVREITED